MPGLAGPDATPLASTPAAVAPSLPIMASLLAAYDRALQRSPLLVKTLTSATLFGAGDLLSQKLEAKEEFELPRFARMVVWGAAFAPLAHGWSSPASS